MSRSLLALLPLEPRDGIESEYDRARREIHRYDTMLRRSSERVATLAESLRRKQAAETSALLPQACLRLRGPVGGVTGGRVAIEDHQVGQRELELVIGPFALSSGQGRGQPRVELRRAGAGVHTVVLDFGSTSHSAGARVCGQVAIQAGEELVARVVVEVELFEASR